MFPLSKIFKKAFLRKLAFYLLLACLFFILYKLHNYNNLLNKLLTNVDMAMKYQLQSKYDKAIDLLTERLELLPADPDSYYLRGLTYFGQSKFEKALDDFKSSIELDPNYVESYYECALIYMKINEFDLCLSNLEKVKELAPKRIIGIDFAVVYEKKGKFKEAIELCEDYLTKTSEESEKLFPGIYEERLEALNKLKELEGKFK